MNPKIHHIGLNERKWDSLATVYDSSRYEYHRWMQEKVIRSIDLRPGICFLDIGCGTGWAVCRVARILRGEGEFHGVDVSSKMIEAARLKCRDLSNVFFHKTDAEHIPLEAQSVDCAICTNSFHHYSSPIDALNEFHRILKVGGRLYILDITADGFLTRLYDKGKRRWEREHVKFYNTKEYQTMFASAQLRYLESKSVYCALKLHFAECAI